MCAVFLNLKRPNSFPSSSVNTKPVHKSSHPHNTPWVVKLRPFNLSTDTTRPTLTNCDEFWMCVLVFKKHYTDAWSWNVQHFCPHISGVAQRIIQLSAVTAQTRPWFSLFRRFCFVLHFCLTIRVGNVFIISQRWRTEPLFSGWHTVIVYKYMTWLGSEVTVGLITKSLSNSIKRFL